LYDSSIFSLSRILVRGGTGEHQSKKNCKDDLSCTILLYSLWAEPLPEEERESTNQIRTAKMTFLYDSSIFYMARTLARGGTGEHPSRR
jgi:hypothetical protein